MAPRSHQVVVGLPFVFLLSSFLIHCVGEVGANTCEDIPSLEDRTDNSGIIAKGRVLQLLEVRTEDNTLPVDFVITEVYKGYPLFLTVPAIRLPVPHGGVTNVYRVGGVHPRASVCPRQPVAQEEYILFLTTGIRPTPGVGDQLLLDLAGEGAGGRGTNPPAKNESLELRPEYKPSVVDPVEVFTLKKEAELIAQLGWKKWSIWSKCSLPCDGGTQTRSRTCPRDVVDACEGASSENRDCNQFRCSEQRDMFDRMNLQDRPKVRHVDGRVTAYRILPDASITIPNRFIYSTHFPPEFSILLVVKPRPMGASLDNSALYPVVFTDSEHRLQLAVNLTRYPALVYGTPDGIRQITFSEYRLNRKWHNLAFSISSDAVTMIADCSQKFVHSLPPGEEISIDNAGYTSIGEPEGGGVVGVDDIAFSGDLEQFVIVEGPDAAELQCSSPDRMFSVPPDALFEHYGRDSSSADVPFDFNPNLINPGRIFTSKAPPTFPAPYSSTTTQESYVTTHPPTSPEVEVEEYTERPRVTTEASTEPPKETTTVATTTPIWTTVRATTEMVDDGGNVIPAPEEISIREDGDGGNVIPSRGDNPDIIIRPEVIEVPMTTIPKPEMTLKRSTTAPRVIAPKMTKTRAEQPTINALPAEIPDTTEDTEGKVNPPGDGYQGDDGGLFRGDTAGSGDGEGEYDDVGVDWSTWSTCTAKCGLGTRYRFGFCQEDSIYYDCQRGHTITSQRRNCKISDCPGVLQWSDWGSCSKTCGEGSVRTRMAFCPDEAAHDDCQRPGQTIMERDKCNVPGCQDVCVRACENRGACLGGACVCPPGYTGDYCQHQTCNPQCRNGGICLSNNICSCPEGTSPPYCTRRCIPECHNGAQCVEGNRCECLDGYQGNRCQSPICTSRCQNGGRCIAPDRCQCPPGYGGNNCGEVQCLLGCENGGECIRPEYCRCPPAYRGSRCEIGYCRERCRHGGTCVGPDRCKCPRAYTGAFCQKSKCPRGCPSSMTCVGVNRCVPISFAGGYRGHSRGSGRRKNCYPLVSYTQQIRTSYVKPVIRNIQVSCGTFGFQTCNSQRLEYTIAYRTAYKTSYRCAGLG